MKRVTVNGPAWPRPARRVSITGRACDDVARGPARWTPSRGWGRRIAGVVGAGLLGVAAAAGVIHDTTTPYHRLRVVDGGGMRRLMFDEAEQSRMALADPLRGHFEYTEYFHLPWLWNPGLTNVLMVGLGGASVQRSYEHYYPQVTVDTAELDAVVLRVARQYFGFRESARQRVQIEDRRMYLRRTEVQYGAILMDAYTASRYGAYVPYHLVTREFFELANQRLTTNGVLCYNMIGTIRGRQADLVGAVHRTLSQVFPQVYLFPAADSQNVVLVATRAADRTPPAVLWSRALGLRQAGLVTLPTFLQRVRALHAEAPQAFGKLPVLVDDFAPIDGLLRVMPPPPPDSFP